MGLATEVHVEAGGVAKRADLVLSRSALDSMNSSMVGVIDVEHGPSSRRRVGAAGLDRCTALAVGRPCHERHRARRRGASGAEQLLRRAYPGQVEAGAGAALKMKPSSRVPVQDRVHRVVDRQDEAGADLLRRRGADVEPDRGVEREVLVQQHPGQLVLEDLGDPRSAK
jgi:hypothetical protein